MMVHVGFDLPDLRAGVARGDVLVLVDVLSFSTAVAAATARGMILLPAGSRRRAEYLGLEKDAQVSVSRKDTAPGRYSLSPLDYAEAPSGVRLVLRSPNGARLAVADWN